MRNTVLLVILCLISTLLFTGCSKQSPKPLTKEQADLVKIFKSLPESAQIALVAKDMVGKFVYNPGTSYEASTVFEIFQLNGAKSATDAKTANYVISSIPNGTGDKLIIVIEKNGNKYTQGSGEDEGDFARRIASVIGTANKIDIVAKAKQANKASNKRFVDIHTKALGIPRPR